MSLFMLSCRLEAKMVMSSFFNPSLHQLTHPAALLCLHRGWGKGLITQGIQFKLSLRQGMHHAHLTIYLL